MAGFHRRSGPPSADPRLRCGGGAPPPEVGQVDPAEQALPVGIVDGRHTGRRGRRRGRSHVASPREVTDSQHLLVRSLTSRVLDLEVAPDRPAQQRASGRRGGLGLLDCSGEATPRRPVAPIAPISAYEPVGRRRARSARALEPGGRRDGFQPLPVGLQGRETSSTQPSDPAVLEGLRPGTELLAYVGHRPDEVTVLGGVVAEIADDVGDLGERDSVAEALLRAKTVRTGGRGWAWFVVCVTAPYSPSGIAAALKCASSRRSSRNRP